MKNFKKLVMVVAIVGVLGTAGAAFAANAKTPADIVSGLTGKSVTEVNKLRDAGDTYATIAQDAGKLDEFKAQTLKERKAILDQRVKDGTLTKERADAMYKAMESNQALCNGTGNSGLGNGQGTGAGRGMMGGGTGAGRGMMGAGTGAGCNR